MKVYKVYLNGQPGPTYETPYEAMSMSADDVEAEFECDATVVELRIGCIEMTREEFDNLPEFRGW